MSKSERELRKLQWTINYNGNKSSREGGRDRGNLLLKLKWRSKFFLGMSEVLMTRSKGVLSRFSQIK